MSKKISDLTTIRQRRRKKSGWTLKEIKDRAAEDFKKYKIISEENDEPGEFNSGDMHKFLEGHDDDNDE
jgi:hypothetical protein